MSSKGIVAAESNESRKKPAKVVDHLELHPKLGGGAIVKHVYTSYQHEPLEVHFNESGKRTGKGGGEHIIAHLDKHGAIPGGTEGYDKQDKSETEEEIES